MIITYPLLLPLTDDNGVLLTAPTVTITSVKDKAGNPIASPGATVNISGPNASVDYDAELHGEAWITLAVSQSGSSVSNANASPVLYASRDAGRIQSGISAAGQVAASNLPTDYQQRGVAVTLPALPTVTVGGYASGQDPGTLLLTTPANKLSTDTGGKVGANNLPSDYQQRGVAVVLPSTAPSGYGGTTAPTVAQIAAGILAVPGTPLANNASGQVAIVPGASVVASNFVAAPTTAQTAAAILRTPANLLATDGNGNVGVNNFPSSFSANNLPSDYQQRGVPVTLPSTAPTGYGGGSSNVAVDGSGRVLLQPSQAFSNSVAGTVAPTWYNAPPTDYQQRGVAVTLPSGEDSSIQTDVTAALTAQGITTARAAKLDNLDAAVSSRSTYAGGNVTVAGYAAGQDPASLLLATPGNKLATNASGYVTTSNPATGGSAVTEATIWAYGNRSLTDKANFSGTATNLPSDYQQRGVAVTLPSGEDSSILADVTAALTTQGVTAARAAKLDNLDAAVSSRSTYAGGTVTVAGYAPGQDPATLLLATPGNKLVTNSSGYVTTSNPASGGSAVTEATIWAYATRSLTDKAGFSGTATNLPSDYQQRGVAATLPANAPSTFLANDASLASVKSDTAKIGSPAGTSLAADVAAVKADTGALASHQKGHFTYDPSTHSLQLLLDDGVTPFGAPLTLTVDSIGNTLSR